jgi:NHLM bacteriocin system ABC transporter peptidase/ATP-binding protein
MEAVECGAAALAMVLGHYGRIVPLEELRLECGVSRDGSKASNVLKAARKYGLIARGYKREIEGLYDLTFPVVLFWKFNHFVVLEGFRNGQAWINDPAEGPRPVSMDELDRAFSGVVLTFERGPDFREGGERPSMLEVLWRRLEGSETALLFVFLCGLFLVIPGLAVPIFARVFIDEYLIAGQTELVQPLLLLMGATAVLCMGLTWLQQYFLLRFETKLAIAGSTRFFDHVLRLPVSYFSQRYAGEVSSRVMINNKVAGMVSGGLATTALNSLLVVFYVLLMLFYDVPLTVICVGIGSLNVLALRWIARERRNASLRLLQEQGKLTGAAMGGLLTIETIKASGSESEFFSRWAGFQAKVHRASQSLVRLGQFVSTVPGIISTVNTAVVLFLGGLKVMDGQLTVGMLVAYQTLMASFVAPLNALVGFGGSLQELEADLNRLNDVLNHPKDPQFLAGSGGRTDIVKLSGAIEVRDLTFGYSPLDPPLLMNLNLKILPGQRVALVGPSGSGKSTLARLIAGLYQPWSGEILLDNIPRPNLSANLLTNSLGSVDQEIFLFEGKVRDNLSMWDPSVPDLNVVGGARDAAIDSVIERREAGYFAPVEEAGANFSGGERQRLEIARALVGNPSVLILDEATSALDPTTEMIIDDNLRRRGCTCIIVAHRLSTIRDCDEILVMDQGQIVQRGTHDKLINEPGLYSKLIET